jgi:hypothetical protein
MWKNIRWVMVCLYAYRFLWRGLFAVLVRKLRLLLVTIKQRSKTAGPKISPAFHAQVRARLFAGSALGGIHPMRVC